jgi:beta-lactamase regulating signal transducer with metallopeptidase domain
MTRKKQMTIYWLHNLLAYGLQIAALIGGSSLLIQLLRVRTPAVRLIWFQSVLAACVLLPFVQPWNTTPAGSYVDGRANGPFAVALPLTNTPAPHSQAPSARDFVFPLLVGGVVVRLTWTVLGLWSLRRYRRASRASNLPMPAAEEFAKRAGIKAEIAISDKIAGPITFGLRSALILLPSHFERMNPETREAIVCHELIHVRRKDWLFTVLEEVILAVLWFHPAAWWLVSQIRLAREQMVDLEAIRITGSQDRYLEALLETARASRPGALVPATSFLWRGQLVKRVAAIVHSAAVVSWRRLVPSLGLALAGTLLVGRMAVMSFPLSTEAQARQQSNAAIQIESGGDHLRHRSAIEYPGWVIARHIEGLVVVEVETNEEGAVSDLRVISGPPELRRVVLQSVLGWLFDPKTQPAGTSQVAIRFRLPVAGQASATVLPEFPGFSEGEATAVAREAEQREVALKMGRMAENAEKVAKGEITGKLVSIQLHGSAEHADLRGRLPIGIGDKVDAESLQRLVDTLRTIDESFRVGLDIQQPGALSLHIFSEESGSDGKKP